MDEKSVAGTVKNLPALKSTLKDATLVLVKDKISASLNVHVKVEKLPQPLADADPIIEKDSKSRLYGKLKLKRAKPVFCELNCE